MGACTASPPADSAPVDNAPAEQSAAEPATAVAGLPTLNGPATVEMVVNGATITIEVDGDNAPVTAGNFVDLVNRGVYDGLVFHRVVREPQPFVVQGGDPQSKDPNVPAQALGTGSFVDPDTNAPAISRWRLSRRMRISPSMAKPLRKLDQHGTSAHP